MWIGNHFLLVKNFGELGLNKELRLNDRLAMSEFKVFKN